MLLAIHLGIGFLSNIGTSDVNFIKIFDDVVNNVTEHDMDISSVAAGELFMLELIGFKNVGTGWHGLRVRPVGGSFQAGATDYEPGIASVAPTGPLNFFTASSSMPIHFPGGAGNKHTMIEGTGRHLGARMIFSNPTVTGDFFSFDGKGRLINEDDRMANFTSSGMYGTIGAIEALRMITTATDFSGRFIGHRVQF